MLYIIGDIHGCYKQLKYLLEEKIGLKELFGSSLKLKLKLKLNKLVFVGDLFDRGPNSYKVYKYIRNLKEKYPDQVYLTIGNHEEMMLEALRPDLLNDKYGFKQIDVDPDKMNWLGRSPSELMRMWQNNGGCTTIDDFKKKGYDINRIKTEVCEWIINNFEYYHGFDGPEYKNQIRVAHASGVRTGLLADDRKIDRTDKATKGLNNRQEDLADLVWDRTQVEFGTYTGLLTVVGHTPCGFARLSTDGKECKGMYKEYEIRYKGIPDHGLINIDTGCVFDESSKSKYSLSKDRWEGKLTGMVVNLEEDCFWLVSSEDEQQKE